MKSVVVLISGRGSNLEAIIRAGLPGARIRAVIANREDAPGLSLARAHGLDAVVVNGAEFADRGMFDEALRRTIDAYAPDLVVLAGFMKVLGEGFVRHFEGRMMNIHPSLLPAFTGLHTHRRALEAGVKVHGATVHFVTPELDAGPIIIQAAVPVHADDDEASLAARVLEQEHRIYPQAIRWFLQGSLEVAGSSVCVRGSEKEVGALIVPPLGNCHQGVE